MVFPATVVAPPVNSNTLRVEEAGIETDDDGFVEVDEYLETSGGNVWAIGDITGNYVFWHSALHEAEYVYRSVRADATRSSIREWRGSREGNPRRR